MKKSIPGAILCGLVLLPAAFPIAGHHSFTATYEEAQRITLEGTVTRVAWANPHAYFFLDVEGPAGTVVNWALEFGDIHGLEAGGWSADTLASGDRVRVEGVPARGTARHAFARAVTRADSGESLFTLSASPPTPRASASTAPPRWPDGRIRLGPEPGEKGYWQPAGTVGLWELEAFGDEAPMNGDALLLDLADADRVAPLQPWAKALYLRRQRRLLADDPALRCMPPGGPRQFQSANGFQFIEQRELDRILVLLGGGNRNWRAIYLDGRPQVQPEEAVRTFYGTSVGRWEDDEVLVVESVGYNERFWFAGGGLPHTESLHLTERYSRPDHDTLSYEVTIDDPGAYTRPWTARLTARWVADREIDEFFCEENAEGTQP